MQWQKENTARKKALEKELADLVEQRNNLIESGLSTHTLNWPIKMLEMDIRDLEKALRIKWAGGDSPYTVRQASSISRSGSKYIGYREAYKRPYQGGKFSHK
ncbi:hypothetical protein LJC63_12135, partial [Ruminococcaceae bacterium OttesenSCG-928-L11]|nr:hypothetical protein [Ruminococcaceae bacterium OttesenSCG-928-L11]